MHTDTTASAAARPTGRGARRAAFKATAAVLSLVLLVTGARLLITGWFDAKDGGIHRVQDLAFGVIEGVILLGGIAAQLRRPARHAAALQQALLGLAALIVTMILTLKVDPPTIAAGALLLLLVALHPARAEVLRFRREPDRARLVLALLGAVPLLVFALHQASLMRATSASDPLVQSSGYAGACAAAIAVTLVALLAAVRGGTGPAAWSASAGALVLGIGSIAFPHHASSLGTAGGAVAIASAALFLGATVRRSAGRQPGRHADVDAPHPQQADDPSPTRRTGRLQARRTQPRGLHQSDG